MKKILILVFLILLLTGCYDYKELNNLAIVSGISIDYINNKYELNLEILNDDELSQNRVYYISDTGESLKEAFKNISLKINRIPLYSHIKIIILSDDVIKKKKKEFINYVIDNPNITTKFYIVRSNNSSNILKFKEQKEISSESIYHLIETTKKKIDFMDLAYAVIENKTLNIPNITIENKCFLITEDNNVNK